MLIPLILGTLLAGKDPAPQADLAADVAVVEAEYGSLAPTAEVFAVPCGQENAFYEPDTDTVIICTEMAAETDATVRFVVAHEFAHAVVAELKIAHVTEEASADELAAVILLGNKDRDAVIAAANWFMDLPPTRTDGVHPPALERARMLVCLDDGLDGPLAADPNCVMYFRRATAGWLRAILTALHADG